VGALRSKPFESLIDSYERLRGDVDARDSVGQRLFRQRGLTAWLTEWGSPACPSPEVRDGVGRLDLPLPATNSRELTFAFANLVHQAAGASA